MSIEDFIKRAFELNVDGVELNQLFFQPERDRLKSIKRQLLSYGLDLSCITVDNNFCLPDEVERRKQVEWVRKWVDATIFLGAPIMRINAGWPPKGVEESKAFTWAVECIKEICKYAEDFGLMITVENHGGITTTADQILKLIDAVNSDWFRVNLDVGNFPQNIYENIEKVAPYTVHVHAKVLELKLSWQGLRSYWSEAKLDYRRIMEILYRVNYNGYLSLEYEGKEDEEVGVSRSIKFLRELISSAP